MKRFALLSLALGFLALPSCGPSEPNPKVLIETSMGDIKVELFQDKAPISVANFLKYVDEKHYDGTIFHRVIFDFMIQGGGFTPDLEQKETGKPIVNESHNGLSNEPYTLAMARTNQADSATDQFFINVSPKNKFLDKANSKDGVGYAVFGKVIDGKNVVEKIRRVEAKDTTVKIKGQMVPFEGLPLEPVIIKSIKRIDK